LAGIFYVDVLVGSMSDTSLARQFTPNPQITFEAKSGFWQDEKRLGPATN
jgi:hypothetical protein